jgi:DNA-binding transcriptional LysR family regulator
MKRLFDPVTLKLFVAVCEERNIGRAAEREAIVPSAISKRIAALEDDVGAPLLVRGRRGIEATPAGEALLRQARDILGMMERARVELAEFTSGIVGSARPSVLGVPAAGPLSGTVLTARPADGWVA